MTVLDPASFDAMRRAMVVSQLRPSGITDARLLDAMADVPRENFVPEGLRPAAYIDRPVPLTAGRALNPPLVTALLLQEAEIQSGETVLLVGCGTGYSAALVAHMGAHPVALECDQALVRATREQLPSAMVVEAVLAEGHAEAGPYDAIVIEGLVEHLPDALVAQLRPDALITAALADKGVSRIVRGRRGGQGFGMTTIADAAAVPLPGFARPKVFAF